MGKCYLKEDLKGPYPYYPNKGIVARSKGALPTCGRYNTSLNNTDLTGDVISAPSAPTADGCCTFCDANAACEGYVFYENVCYLKKNVRGTSNNPGREARMKAPAPSPLFAARCGLAVTEEEAAMIE